MCYLVNQAQKQFLVTSANKFDLVPGAVLAHAELASQLEGAEGLAGSQLQGFCLSQTYCSSCDKCSSITLQKCSMLSQRYV